jgi:hypothetical protein
MKVTAKDEGGAEFKTSIKCSWRKTKVFFLSEENSVFSFVFSERN